MLSGVKVQSFTFTTEAQSSQRNDFLFVPRNPWDKQKAVRPLGNNINLAEGQRPSGESASPDSPESCPTL